MENHGFYWVNPCEAAAFLWPFSMAIPHAPWCLNISLQNWVVEVNIDQYSSTIGSHMGKKKRLLLIGLLSGLYGSELQTNHNGSALGLGFPAKRARSAWAMARPNDPGAQNPLVMTTSLLWKMAIYSE